ncbi:MAG: response regulator transcription factor [Alphaproteobacteria bacterium]|nr:response regulator transcription factor [Alphaproteobacteria bacterium]
MKTRSFLVCDDHALVRQALAMTLQRACPDCRISDCASFSEAWELAKAASHDLCICDLSMPGADAISGLARLKAIAPDLAIIAITGSSNEATLQGVIALGIQGLVSKAQSAETIEQAIVIVLEGGVFIPVDTLQFAITVKPGPQDWLCKKSSSLTQHQMRVLQLIAQGHSNKEIARQLDVLPSTIKFHVDGILERLAAKNRVEAIGKFLQTGGIFSI